MTSPEKDRLEVAYLGPPSSYTHQAAAHNFPRDRYILETEVSIPDVFFAVQSSKTSYGVVPFENSSNGSVLHTLDCLIDRDVDFPDISVFGEIYLDVRHCLVGLAPSKNGPESRLKLSPTSSGQATPTKAEPSPKKPRSQPLVDISHVTDIYSHPQAFGQCQRFLSTYLKQANHHETASTSKAAEIVKESGSHTSAAISSVLAAEVHDLSLLAKDIQDREDNTTRFLTICKRQDNETPNEIENPIPSEWKSLIVFSVDHALHGALAKALLVFEKHQLNLTHFNSRPSRVRPWHYIFIVECEFLGTRPAVSTQVDKAMLDLEQVTEIRKCLGYWQESVGRRQAD